MNLGFVFLKRLASATFVFALVLLLCFAALSSSMEALPAGSDAPLVTARRTFTAEEQELVREALGLHLPLLWRSEVPCPRDTVQRALQSAQSTPTAWQAVERLGAMAVVHATALPWLAEQTESTQVLRAKLASLEQRVRAATDVSPSMSIAEAWRTAWSPDAVDSAVAALLAAAAKEPQGLVVSRQKLAALGGLGAEALHHAALTASWPARLEAWQCLASNFGFGFDLQAARRDGIDSAAAHAAAARVERWWQAHAMEFTEPSGFESFSRHASATRFWSWCRAAATGNLGESLEYRQPVGAVLAEHLPLTLRLGSITLLLMLLLALPVGVAWARMKAGRSQRAVEFAVALAASTPEVVLGTVLLIFSSRGSGLLLPSLVLGLGGAVLLAAHLRAALLEAEREPWVHALRGRGVSEARILRSHLLRHALSPVITLLGAALPLLVGGSVVVEHLFGLQGMGEVAWNAATHGDVALSMACVALGSGVALAGWLLADLLGALMDPRRATYRSPHA
ncbi:MAG: ABC transporter permease [Planctomycetes bacterium]|nr:ABC transporter permease [Planctomycetota bacterium]